MNTKKTNLYLALTAAAGLSLLAPTAKASDGTINFSGEVLTQTCAPATGSGSGFTVTLEPVTAVELTAAAGGAVKNKPFTISLKGCTPDSGLVAILFDSPTNLDETTHQLKPDVATGNATGVEIRLLNDNAGDNTQIMVGAEQETQNSLPVEIDSAGNATLSYQAAYVQVGSPTAGPVTAQAVYTIVYP